MEGRAERVASEAHIILVNGFIEAGKGEVVDHALKHQCPVWKVLSGCDLVLEDGCDGGDGADGPPAGAYWALEKGETRLLSELEASHTSAPQLAHWIMKTVNELAA